MLFSLLHELTDVLVTHLKHSRLPNDCPGAGLSHRLSVAGTLVLGGIFEALGADFHEGGTGELTGKFGEQGLKNRVSSYSRANARRTNPHQVTAQAAHKRRERASGRR